MIRLKDNPIFFGKAQFLQRGLASKLDHRRRSAHEKLRIFRTFEYEVLFEHTLAHESRIVLPVRVVASVHRVPERKSVREFLLQSFQFRSHQNVVFRLVGVNQLDLRRSVRFIAENVVQDLEHGRDTRATRHHANVARVTRFMRLAQRFDNKLSRSLPLCVSLGAFDEHGIANLESIQVLTHFSALWKSGGRCFVNFDDEREFAKSRIICHWGIRALYSLTIRVGKCETDMLARRQTENVFPRRQRKRELGRIVRQDVFANQSHGHEVIERQRLRWA